jgi:hypothetical protein
MLRLSLLLLAGVIVAATSAAAENPAPGKPAENAVPAKPAENATPATPAANAAPAKPAAKPKTSASKSRAYTAARQLPPGLPRAGYRYRTTVAPATPYRDPVVYETDQDLLITPAYGPGGYLANLPGTPILPGSTTIPGYYGRAFSYDYQGPYYGGPYEGYFWRLPYACGVYGYC